MGRGHAPKPAPALLGSELLQVDLCSLQPGPSAARLLLFLGLGSMFSGSESRDLARDLKLVALCSLQDDKATGFPGWLVTASSHRLLFWSPCSSQS